MALTDRLTGHLVRSRVPLERSALESAVRELARLEAPLASETELKAVVDGLVGLGPLEELLTDPAVTDVLVNGPGDIWVERGGELVAAGVRFRSDEEVVAAVERVIAPLGLRIDRASPTVDARLADGSRIHAVIPPAAVDHPVVAIRRFTQAIADFDGLVAAGTASGDQVLELLAAVEDRRNIIVAGGTGTGKTTLLNLLSAEIPAAERIVTIEDAAELRLAGHVVRLEARPANSEGAGAITLTQLLKSALRLRPDRIIVGEVRGPEALDLVAALNTGHAGSMSTVHANSPEEAIWRLETLALSGDRRVSSRAIRRQLQAAVDLVVQLDRRGGLRRISEIRVFD